MNRFISHWLEYPKRRKLKEGDFVIHRETGKLLEVYLRYSGSIFLLKMDSILIEARGSEIKMVTKQFRDENPELFL